MNKCHIYRIGPIIRSTSLFLHSPACNLSEIRQFTAKATPLNTFTLSNKENLKLSGTKKYNKLSNFKTSRNSLGQKLQQGSLQGITRYFQKVKIYRWTLRWPLFRRGRYLDIRILSKAGIVPSLSMQFPMNPFFIAFQLNNLSIGSIKMKKLGNLYSFMQVHMIFKR